MTGKEKADPKASPNTQSPNNTSASAQRARLLERLHAGPVDTITARNDLNLMMPAARIKELRNASHTIKTQRITLTDEHGRTHHGVALYFLSQSEA
ncbi:helix-turn-helix domain-containing protein [Halopseudomonas sp.]|uniref:helix-turn-helix domain-containing protein n=1 Tax=Halopseudomonas sp. TaxID=2901191 RepID=UPI0030021415